MTDNVNHPSHYGGDTPYEAIKVMLAWHGPEAVYWFCVLNAEKYLSRAGKKDGVSAGQDTAKAAWYLDYASKLGFDPGARLKELQELRDRLQLAHNRNCAYVDSLRNAGLGHLVETIAEGVVIGFDGKPTT